MIDGALEAEVQDSLDAARGERDEQGHSLVVRNGHANERNTESVYTLPLQKRTCIWKTPLVAEEV